MKILMIDNYDSFTYNLFQYLAELGADVKVIRNDKIVLKEIEQLNPDKIVISPGPCTPNEAGISVDLVKKFSGKIPILGVCLGHQCIGAAFGAKIVKAKKLMHGKTSEIIYLKGNTNLFQGIQQGFVAVRYHSLVIQQSSLPKELKITALSDDGEIMGVRHEKFDVEGIQFHPEAIFTKDGETILKNFLFPGGIKKSQ